MCCCNADVVVVHGPGGGGGRRVRLRPTHPVLVEKQGDVEGSVTYRATPRQSNTVASGRNVSVFFWSGPVSYCRALEQWLPGTLPQQRQCPERSPWVEDPVPQETLRLKSPELFRDPMHGIAARAASTKHARGKGFRVQCVLWGCTVINPLAAEVCPSLSSGDGATDGPVLTPRHHDRTVQNQADHRHCMDYSCGAYHPELPGMT